MSGALRQVLAEIVAARGTAHLGEIARRAGITRDEAEAIVDYWVERGRLSRDRLGGCPPRGCGGCALADGCSARDGQAQVTAITVRPRAAREPEPGGG
ncbi:FeoC-like transcriptional regulator [Nonomuraea pusilla]|uniref:FeoC-like transcriptional regulator n=1 Tax=Nonomuraea pusilla TaxID=46177 RepID=UPI0033176272